MTVVQTIWGTNIFEEGLTQLNINRFMYGYVWCTKHHPKIKTKKNKKTDRNGMQKYQTNMQNLSYETHIFTKKNIPRAHLNFRLQCRPSEIALAFRSAQRNIVNAKLINLLSRHFDEKDELQMKWLLQGLDNFPNRIYEKKSCRTLLYKEHVSIIVRDAIVYNPSSENFIIELTLPGVDFIYVRVAYNEMVIVSSKINLTQEERRSDDVSDFTKFEKRPACKTRYTPGSLFWHAKRDNEGEQRDLDSENGV